MSTSIYKTDIKSLPKVASGKVKDIYAVGEDKLLIVTTDRISANNIAFPTPIPDKGKVLVGISNFWFKKLADIVPNDTIDIAPESVVAPDEIDQVAGRAVVVHRLRAIPIEAVIHGHLACAEWKAYQKTGIVSGQLLPLNIKEAEKLPTPIFTPTTKAAQWDYDQHLTFAKMELQLAENAHKIREISCQLYKAASEIAEQAGLMIANSKFEFGFDKEGNIVLIDEILTPDSCRYWFKKDYTPGAKPKNIGKQLFRDYLEEIDWNKKPPAPILPDDVVSRLRNSYLDAYQAIIGHPLTA